MTVTLFFVSNVLVAIYILTFKNHKSTINDFSLYWTGIYYLRLTVCGIKATPNIQNFI